MKVYHTHRLCLFHAFFIACVKLLTMIDFSQMEKIEKKLEAITMRETL